MYPNYNYNMTGIPNPAQPALPTSTLAQALQSPSFNPAGQPS
jgi:hypothetical protein